MPTLLRNIRQIVNVISLSELKLTSDIDDVAVTSCRQNEKMALLINDDGKIEDFGLETKFSYLEPRPENIIDCKYGVVLPGFVDGHTHPVWSGDRVHEFAMKLSGASYMQIHEKGGGIHFTVRHTADASEEQLYKQLKDRLKAMAKKGTTSIECKSGYGLEWSTEKKMLRVLTKAKRELPLDLSITYLAAHAVPKKYTSDEFTEIIINEQIPLLKEAIDSDELLVDNIDVFCEKGVYSTEQTRRILEAGNRIGLASNFHADELTDQNGAQLAGQIMARAASHLEEASPAGVAAMAASGTAAVLLPTTAQLLRLRPPPAQAIMQAGVPVALGTDFNPNAYCTSMPIVMYLACTLLHMTLDQALVGATLNSAYSIGMSDRIGAITPGRQADLVVLNCDSWEHIIYQFGEAENLIDYVIKKGKIIYSKESGFNGFD